MNTNSAPIHNLQIGQGVLAALMTVTESYAQVENLLTVDDFYAYTSQTDFSSDSRSRLKKLAVRCCSELTNGWK